MTETAQRLRTELATLNSEDRADLACFLLESLNEESDANCEAELDTELDRRIAEIESGNLQGIPGDEVMAELREMFS